MYVPHFIYMLISWWVFELFSFLAVMNNAAVNICLQDLHEYVFSFLLKWNLGVEVLDHKVTMCLTFWRTARQFSKWLHHLHSCQKCMRFLVSLHPNQYMLLSVFMNLALLARTTLSWLPLFCRKFCSWGVQILLYSFPRFFFAILGPLNSIWILGSACQCLRRS